MISEVIIRNYKSLRDVRIGLERFTVFVGPNGCGKSSVLSAIHYLVRAATGDAQKVFSHERHGDWIYCRGGVGDLSIGCYTEGGEFRIEATPPQGYPPAPEYLQKGNWNYRVSPSGSALDRALQPARKLVFLQLNAGKLALPSYSETDPPRMDYTGEGLASVLAFMNGNDPAGFEKLSAHARSLIPRLKRIRFRKAPVVKTEREILRIGHESVDHRTRRKYLGDLILFDFENAENVSARTASEGTMLMLGLLTVLLGPSHPQIVLLDDIEHGLHPLAQKQLVGVIGQILSAFPDLQVLATAHSPYLLDYVEAHQIRVMTTGSDGFAHCGKLTDHPQYPKWKDELSPGELWSIFGEKWVAEKGAVK